MEGCGSLLYGIATVNRKNHRLARSLGILDVLCRFWVSRFWNLNNCHRAGCPRFAPAVGANLGCKTSRQLSLISLAIALSIPTRLPPLQTPVTRSGGNCSTAIVPAAHTVHASPGCDGCSATFRRSPGSSEYSGHNNASARTHRLRRLRATCATAWRTTTSSSALPRTAYPARARSPEGEHAPASPRIRTHANRIVPASPQAARQIGRTNASQPTFAALITTERDAMRLPRLLQPLQRARHVRFSATPRLAPNYGRKPGAPSRSAKYSPQHFNSPTQANRRLVWASPPAQPFRPADQPPQRPSARTIRHRPSLCTVADFILRARGTRSATKETALSYTTFSTVYNRRDSRPSRRTCNQELY